ncbi:MAG: D-glycero-beta-D-manno-heptose 1-phosphate adenylyltransferase [Nitrospirae bacterium]|nr:MAG: D-glycero-beta-D-manno-heptose 1-phosphate adenylyltransferase [Nitrospirota bacterium]
MKLKSKEELRDIINDLKKRGKRVVFTNGCFDILHAGHVSYLHQARQLGDVLVVGINSDESVKRLKPKRPIVPCAQRVEVLSALEMVDYVVVFDEDTPYELIKTLEPDVLVKGGDWKVQEIVGSDLVRETYSLPYREGLSTTSIINRIIERYC